jgi:hypothetical protein
MLLLCAPVVADRVGDSSVERADVAARSMRLQPRRGKGAASGGGHRHVLLVYPAAHTPNGNISTENLPLGVS